MDVQNQSKKTHVRVLSFLLVSSLSALRITASLTEKNAQKKMSTVRLAQEQVEYAKRDSGLSWSPVMVSQANVLLSVFFQKNSWSIRTRTSCD